MEQKIIEILKDNFKGQNIDKARKELCFLFDVMRSDSPKCPKCNNDNYAELDSVGDYWQEDAHNVEHKISCDSMTHLIINPTMQAWILCIVSISF